MKMVATMALKPGMVVGEEVVGRTGQVIVNEGAVLDSVLIKKLSTHAIMCVSVKEEIDFAVTHFEKVRLSPDFQVFEKKYNEEILRFKAIMIGYITNNISFSKRDFLKMYYNITEKISPSEKVLDYLYNMLPSEDDMTYAHLLNAALIGGVFADWLGLSANDKEILILTGFLYDVGKLKLPNELIWKPGKLTDLEFTKMKTHTLIGFEMLSKVPLDDHIKRAALSHHERCDGTGYPSKLKDGQIDIFAKYAAIIDSYEAMTSARTYRTSMNPFQVIANFERNGFLQYDESIIRPILSRIAGTMLGLNVKLNDERICEIVLINQSKLSRPLLKHNDQLIDLSREDSLSIEAIY